MAGEGRLGHPSCQRASSYEKKFKQKRIETERVQGVVTERYEESKMNELKRLNSLARRW